MRQAHLKSLEEALELKQKELDLVMAIDAIRDNASGLLSMLSAIANILSEHLPAELCAIALLDRDTAQLELKAIYEHDHNGNLEHFLTVSLAERAVGLDDIAVWNNETAGLETAQLPQGLQVAAVPIIMNENERLGALLLFRDRSEFKSRDIQLLKTAESMIDSAVIQGYADHELKQRVKELEAIYRIDHIRDRDIGFDEMLNEVLQEICKVIDAEMGFTMLYDNSGHRLELRATTHSDLFRISAHQEQLNQLAHKSLQQTRPLRHNRLGAELRSAMCLPLILNDQIIGVLGMANHRNPKGFSMDDQRILTAIGSQIDTAIFESIERRQLRQVLGRSVDPHIMERLLANPNVDFLKGERAVLTVLYADLRGSTELAERTDPEMLVGFINHYLGQMTEVILGNEGTLDKFVGDEVMALFGAPFPQEDHALRAVRVGLEMQQAHQSLMEMWQDRNITVAPIGIGIATGELIVGEMGCAQRADYTVIGRAANLGARICSAAKAGQVLVSQETYDLIQSQADVTAVTGLQFKGVHRDITVYRVNSLIK